MVQICILKCKIAQNEILIVLQYIYYIWDDMIIILYVHVPSNLF